MKLNSESDMLDFGAQFAQKLHFAANHSSDSQTADRSSKTPKTDHSDTPETNQTPEKSPSTSNQATILELIGDVGTGKTTFARGLARELGIKEPVTSPSFTISKTYALPDQKSLVHYDFYRLSDPGLMADDLAETLTNPQNIVVIEWGESVQNLLPTSRYILEFNHNDDGSHEVNIKQEPAQ